LRPGDLPDYHMGIIFAIGWFSYCSSLLLALKKLMSTAWNFVFELRPIHESKSGCVKVFMQVWLTLTHWSSTIQ
jgi:hypothetical protein